MKCDVIINSYLNCYKKDLHIWNSRITSHLKLCYEMEGWPLISLTNLESSFCSPFWSWKFINVFHRSSVFPLLISHKSYPNLDIWDRSAIMDVSMLSKSLKSFQSNSLYMIESYMVIILHFSNSHLTLDRNDLIKNRFWHCTSNLVHSSYMQQTVHTNKRVSPLKWRKGGGMK